MKKKLAVVILIGGFLSSGLALAEEREVALPSSVVRSPTGLAVSVKFRDDTFYVLDGSNVQSVKSYDLKGFPKDHFLHSSMVRTLIEKGVKFLVRSEIEGFSIELKPLLLGGMFSSKKKQAEKARKEAEKARIKALEKERIALEKEEVIRAKAAKEAAKRVAKAESATEALESSSSRMDEIRSRIDQYSGAASSSRPSSRTEGRATSPSGSGFNPMLNVPPTDMMTGLPFGTVGVNPMTMRCFGINPMNGMPFA